MKITWAGIFFGIGMLAMFLICQEFKCTGKKVYIEKKGIPVTTTVGTNTAHFNKAVVPKPRTTYKVPKKQKETPNIEIVNQDTTVYIPCLDSLEINVYNDTTKFGRAKFIQRDSVQGKILYRVNGCIGCYDTTFVYVTDTIILPPKKTLFKDLAISFGAGYLFGLLTGVFAK